MNRFGAVFWIVLVVVAGFATFKAKYAIQDLEDQLAKVRKQTVATQSEIRILNAEWQYLNQPERLAEMNKRFLNLSPITPKQLQERVEDIPLRPVPAPATTPELVAEATSGSTASAPAAATVASAPARAMAAAPPPAAAAPTQVAAAVRPPSGTAGAPRATPVAASAGAPRATPAVARGLAPRVQLAKAGPASLDSLIAQIAEVH